MEHVGAYWFIKQARFFIMRIKRIEKIRFKDLVVKWIRSWVWDFLKRGEIPIVCWKCPQYLCKTSRVFWRFLKISVRRLTITIFSCMFNEQSRTLDDLPELQHEIIDKSLRFVKKTSNCFAHALSKQKFNEKTSLRLESVLTFKHRNRPLKWRCLRRLSRVEGAKPIFLAS